MPITFSWFYFKPQTTAVFAADSTTDPTTWYYHWPNYVVLPLTQPHGITATCLEIMT